jgi:hypothetical protein
MSASPLSLENRPALVQDAILTARCATGILGLGFGLGLGVNSQS